LAAQVQRAGDEEKVQQAAQTAAFTLREMQDKEVQLQAQLEQALQQTKDAEASGATLQARVLAAEILAQSAAAELQLLIEENAALRRDAVAAESSILAAETSAESLAAQVQRAGEEHAILARIAAAELLACSGTGFSSDRSGRPSAVLKETAALQQELADGNRVPPVARAGVHKANNELAAMEQMLATVRTEGGSQPCRCR